jgi:hypothetical protein
VSLEGIIKPVHPGQQESWCLWWFLTALAVVFGIVSLAPELGAPAINDDVLHELLAEEGARHWHAHWPVDFWFPPVSTGFPLVGFYQHLSHLTAALVSHVARIPDQAGLVFAVLRLLVLVLTPLSIHLSTRRLGFTHRAAALAGALYVVLNSAGYYGIGWDSYVWRGHGLSTQAWGVFFMFPALAWGLHALRKGSVWTAGLLLAACSLSHMMTGYLAALLLALSAALPDAATSWRRRCSRLVGVAAVTAAGVAYFAIPLILNRGVLLKSRWEPSWKWDSMGWQWVLPRLARGEVFDGAGWPVLSILVAFGFAVVGWRALRGRPLRHDSQLDRWLVVGFCFCLLLWFGRATWGPALLLLPLSEGLHMHRFIVGVQVFGVMLAAQGVENLLVMAQQSHRRFWARCVMVVVVIGLAHALVTQRAFVRQGQQWLAEAKTALESADDFDEIVEELRQLPAGRVHAGFAGTWGKSLTIGTVPAYVHLQRKGFDMVGYLFMAMARPGEWQMRLDVKRAEHCDLYNIRYIIAPQTQPQFDFAKVAQNGRFVLYEVPTSGYFALGQIGTTGSNRDSRPAPDAEWEHIYQEGDAWLQGTGPREGRYLLLDPAQAREFGGSGGTILDETVAPGRYGCQVASAAETGVVLKVTSHPWWRCTVDGEAARISRIYPDFMAVRVPPGRHRVDFRYEVPWWKKFLFAIAVTTLGWGVVGEPLLRWRRRSQTRIAVQP